MDTCLHKLAATPKPHTLRRPPLRLSLFLPESLPRFRSLPESRNRPPVVKSAAETVEEEALVCAGSIPNLRGGRFGAGRISFLEQHRVRSYEVGPDRLATVPTVANLLQETASNHAICLWGKTLEGFATHPIMVEKNLMFALTRLQIKMEEHPTWGDVLEIETWFCLESRASARRDWVIRSVETSKILGRATSTWVMVDTMRRRMARIPEEMKEKWMGFTCQERYAIPPEETKQKIPELIDPEVPGPTRVALHSNEDMNGHINNVAYMLWAMDTVPDEMHKNYTLTEVELDFKAECNAGDCIEASLSHCEPTNGSATQLVFLHSLKKSNGSQPAELIRLRTKWLPI